MEFTPYQITYDDAYEHLMADEVIITDETMRARALNTRIILQRDEMESYTHKNTHVVNAAMSWRHQVQTDPDCFLKDVTMNLMFPNGVRVEQLAPSLAREAAVEYQVKVVHGGKLSISQIPISGTLTKEITAKSTVALPQLTAIGQGTSKVSWMYKPFNSEEVSFDRRFWTELEYDKSLEELPVEISLKIRIGFRGIKGKIPLMGTASFPLQMATQLLSTTDKS